MIDSKGVNVASIGEAGVVRAWTPNDKQEGLKMLGLRVALSRARGISQG